MTSETDFTIYTVVVVHGGLLVDIATFLDETAAQAYLEGIVVKNEPETVDDMSRPDTIGDRADALWAYVTEVPGGIAIRNHYRCRLCGKIVQSHGNFGGGTKMHGLMHVRQGEAEAYAGGRRHTHLEFRIIKKEAAP